MVFFGDDVLLDGDLDAGDDFLDVGVDLVLVGDDITADEVDEAGDPLFCGDLEMLVSIL